MALQVELAYIFLYKVLVGETSVLMFFFYTFHSAHSVIPEISMCLQGFLMINVDIYGITNATLATSVHKWVWAAIREREIMMLE